MPRLYVDVTATAGTLHHTGIQRIVRSIAIQGAVCPEPVAPVVWNGSNGFRTLKPRERERIFEVFSEGVRRKSFWSGLSDVFSSASTVEWSGGLERPVLLIPEIPDGGRLRTLGELARSMSGEPEMVGICHDVLSWSHPEFTHSDRARGFVSYLRFLCRLDRVICPSKTTAAEYLRFQREEDLAGPEPEVMPWPVDGEPEPLLPEKGNPLVLCVGTLEVRKNHERLLAACESLWKQGVRFRLHLVGRLRAKGEDLVPRRVKELQQAGHPVEWTPRLSDRDLDALFREARFSVFPSLAEGFGLPVAESLVRGRPCVCSGEGAVGEISAGGGCERVDPTDVSSLAAGISRLLGDERYLQQLMEDARAREWPEWNEWLERAFPDMLSDDGPTGR